MALWPSLSAGKAARRGHLRHRLHRLPSPLQNDYSREDPLWVTEAIADLINPAGRVSIIGVWPLKDPNGVEPSFKQGKLKVPCSKLFNNNVRIAMGRDDDKRWNSKLRDMIINGAAKPSQVVSHRLALDEAPDAFEKFDRREDGYIKISICLAGSGRGQVQCLGCAQMEQSFQEPGGWPGAADGRSVETLTNTLWVCAPFSVRLPPLDLAGDYHGTNGLFGPVVRRPPIPGSRGRWYIASRSLAQMVLAKR